MIYYPSISDILKRFSPLKLSHLPTPLQRMDNLSRMAGKNLYCKRDDLTGFAFGGNKTRKLDYLISDAISTRSDCLVTYGSNQSNWCRMASAAGAYAGMDVFLILEGNEPDKLTGNLVLDGLVGAAIEYYNNSDPEAIVDAAMSKVNSLQKSGRKPYYLPVGGSVVIGTLGYLRAFNEILDYSRITGTGFDKIFVASGSAGTQAGLITGQILAGWEGTIIGVSVGRAKSEQEDMVRLLVMETFKYLGLEVDPLAVDRFTNVDESYYGAGYRINTDSAGDAIKLFARSEGIFLDEVYTGKAASGLLGYIETGKIDDEDNTLFIHTGGGIQLFE